eukprot:scaffold50859_cov14-Tisochrysis_lutea.AAC.1
MCTSASVNAMTSRHQSSSALKEASPKEWHGGGSVLQARAVATVLFVVFLKRRHGGGSVLQAKAVATEAWWHLPSHDAGYSKAATAAVP